MKNKIVLIPFPFDDLSSTKVRPALFLTDVIGSHEHVILAFFTSRVPDSILDSDMVIDPSQGEGVQTGLKVISTLRLHCLMTVSKSLIKKELGSLPQGFVLNIQSKIKSLFKIG